MNWLAKDAAQPDWIRRAGTFRRAWMQCIERHLIPILAGVVAYLDTNHNLDLLQQDELPPWVSNLWLRILNDESLVNFRYLWTQVATVKLFIDYMSPLVQGADKVQVDSKGVNYTLLWTLLGKEANLKTKKTLEKIDEFLKRANSLMVKSLLGEREVSEHITHFLDEAREMIQGQMGEAAQSSLVLTELSLLVIHCVENLEHEKEAVDESRSRAGDESSFESQCRYVKDLLHAVRMVLDSSPMELQTLTSLGRLRYALGAFARILHESVVKPEEHPAFTMQLKDLFIEASNVCAMSSTEWPNDNYLINLSVVFVYRGRVVAQMVQPAVDAAHVVTFFWGHLQQDIAVLQRILNKCCDDVYLVLHQLCHKLAGRQPGENQLLNLVFEVGEDAGEEASARNLQQTAAAWKFRTLITVNHFLRQFQLQTTQGSTDSLPVLRLFFEESHHLRALYFLPDILAHQHRLMQQLRKKLSRADAAQKTIGDMLDRKDCAGLKRLLELFSKAWDIVKEFLVSYRLCAYLLNHYLLVQHNNFLERYCPLVKLSYEQVPEVPVPAVTSHHLLGYSEQSDLLPLEAFDDQGEHLRKDLTEEQKQDLQEALSRSSRERLDVLLQQIFECIMLRLMQQTEEGYASPDNYSLRWLVLDNSEYPQYAEDPEEKQQEELTEYDLRKFPDSVTASQAISVWLLLHAHLSGR
nr:hypothetical protein BaRGS_008127 [Batillaria attramentaria]